MVGAYSAALAIYRRHGIQIYPTRPDVPTKSMVRQPGRFRARTVDERFKDANAAFIAGANNNITVIDIDAPGSYYVDMATEMFGDTPYVIKTPSGGTHLAFLHSGEIRSIRPFGNDVPIDLLGGGTVVAPPSRRIASEKKCAGEYRTVGDLEAALANLPPIREGALPVALHKPVTSPTISVGNRNNTLFTKGRAIAAKLSKSHADEGRLIENLLLENARLDEPLLVAEVQKICNNIWRYKIADRLLPHGSRTGHLNLQEINVLSAYPSASILLAYLRAHHTTDHIFAVSTHGIAESGALQMAPKTIKRARDYLIEYKFLEEVPAQKWILDKRQPDQFRLSQSWGQNVPTIEPTPSPLVTEKT